MNVDGILEIKDEYLSNEEYTEKVKIYGMITENNKTYLIGSESPQDTQEKLDLIAVYSKEECMKKLNEFITENNKEHLDLAVNIKENVLTYQEIHDQHDLSYYMLPNLLTYEDFKENYAKIKSSITVDNIKIYTTSKINKNLTVILNKDELQNSDVDYLLANSSILLDIMYRKTLDKE